MTGDQMSISLTTAIKAMRTGFRHGLRGVYHRVPGNIRRWYDFAFKVGDTLR